MLLQRLLCTLCMLLVSGVAVYGADHIAPPVTIPVNPQSISLSPEIGADADFEAAVVTQSVDSRATYDCWLRVYIIEPHSRWLDANGAAYENTLVDFGLDTALSLAYQETYQTTRTWTSPLGIGDVSSDNIKVVAGIFSQEDGGTGQSDTGTSTLNPFTIHVCDAAAAAAPGVPGYDTAYGLSTHTVLIEKATWGG